MALSIETVLRIDLLGGIALSIEKRFDFYLVEWQGKISSDCSFLDKRKKTHEQFFLYLSGIISFALVVGTKE
ncbi:unnamed protein product [Rhizophagus irregularis]|nr:unnamed protein product [Rhizophagus irregularis]